MERSVKNPAIYIFDFLTSVILYMFVPFPLARTTISYLKVPILGCLLALIIIGVMFIATIGVVLIIPLTPSTILNFLPAPNINIGPINFDETQIPTHNPFGGSGLNFTTVTAGFMDPSYFAYFGKVHTGIDLVPSNIYTQNSEEYKKTKKVGIFSTHNGHVTFYVDQYGSETVEVLNQEGNLKTLYLHLSEVFVKDKKDIKAGDPIGIMGRTGFATGEHLHYEIRVKNEDKWIPVNPLSYIK